MTAPKTILFFVFVFFAIFCGESTFASIDTNDPNIPPIPSTYFGDDTTYLSINTIVLSQLEFNPSFLSAPPTPAGANEIVNFFASLSGFASINGGANIPLVLTGPVTTIASGKVGNTTGLFPVEMVAMNLSGGGLLIRESPTLPSLGLTSVATNPSGPLYHIDSFFDVFTELSFDGGQTWIPSSGSTHLSLGGTVPELTSVAIWSILGLVGAGMGRRPHRQTPGELIA